MRPLLLTAFALAATSPAHAQTADEPEGTLTIPEPVSGRRTAQPESITPADNLARVGLLHDNLELIRTFMGRPAPPPPLLRVENAQPREVFFQSYNLVRRSRKLAYEQLRTPVRRGPLDLSPKTPADVLGQLDKALLVVLKVKQHLGIDEAVAERVRPDSTTASDVFNAMVEAGQLLNAVLESETTSTDTYWAVTLAVNVASSLHVERTRSFLPKVPAFEPNQTNADTYRELLTAFGQVRRIGQASGIDMLRFTVDEGRIPKVSGDQVVELVAVLLAELNYLHVRLTGRPAEFVPYLVGRRYPSHALQRARYLSAILARLEPKEPR